MSPRPATAEATAATTDEVSDLSTHTHTLPHPTGSSSNEGGPPSFPRKMVQASVGVQNHHHQGGGGTPMSSSSSSDAKLVHLVKKLAKSGAAGAGGDYSSVTEQGGGDASANVANSARDVVERLRNQHREYQRKDVDRLTAQVESILRQHDMMESSSGTASAATSPLRQQQEGTSSIAGRKRKVPDRKGSRRNSIPAGPPDGGDDDDDHVEEEGNNKKSYEDEDDMLYEQAALAHDAMQSHLASVTSGGGGLNAALRNRYLANNNSSVQQGGQQRPKSTAPAPGEAAMGPERADSEAAPPNSGESDAVKSPKLKRKGSKLMKRSSSSFAGAGGGGGSGMPYDSSSSSFLSPVPRPHERYEDLGGMDAAIQELRQLVEYPLRRPELYRHLGIDPPRGVLLRGPPGCGKTHFANAVAGELGVPYFRVSAPELVSGMSGESEGRIRELFAAASESAPALIFLDEIDAIAPKRGDGAGGSGGRGMEKRMVAQLLTCLDMLAPQNNRDKSPVLVLAATNRPDSLDPALRRAGRFDKEILLGVPDEEARERILRSATKSMRLSGGFDYKVLARKTPGFVGADVQSLAKEAAILAIHRICREVLHESVDSVGGVASTQPEPGASVVSSLAPLSAEQMEGLYVTMDDFLEAVPLVQPSSKREGFATVPDVTWNDIGALQSIRDELTLSVLEPIRSPEKFKALGLTLPAGVLLYGPPGCGKTLLAKAIANESGANFISVKGPELLDKYVGESERAVRLVFERARSSSPCIVFFDELDSLVPKRGSDSSGSGVSERVVNQLLTELDGLDSRRSVFVIAATNRPELIDPAMLRPGRLDKLMYVPLPSPDDRVSILRALAVNIALDTDVDFEAIGKSPKATGYSGADCAALLREAGLAVLKEDTGTKGSADSQPAATPSLCISARHFDAALSSVMPSVSIKDQARYDRIRDRIARVRCRVEPEADGSDGDDKAKS